MALNSSLMFLLWNIKKPTEKRDIIYDLKRKREDGIIVFNVFYSERGRVTKTDEILKSIKERKE